jgi:serine-type D-Ala-D-Ala endopeptidase (penicillin-binding protein 7)
MIATFIISLLLTTLLEPQIVSFRETNLIEQAFIEQTVATAPTRLNLNNLGPKLSARGAVAIDRASRTVLWGKNIDQPLPIASISKLMAALIVLDEQVELNQSITMLAQDETVGGTQHLARGEQLSVKDLLYTALIPSANNATEALVRATGLGRDKFVEQMNKKARELGMLRTNFVEPTGLKYANIASPRDVAILLDAALQYDLIQNAVSRATYSFTSLSGRAHKLFNTDQLLTSYLDIIGGKTGYNDESLYNLTVAINGDKGQTILVTVLGTESIEARFQEAKILADWAFENYYW